MEGVDSFPGEGLGEADAVAGGLADVGVVEEPVDGGGGQGLGHELVEPGGVQVRGERDRAFLVGGVDEAVETFGGVVGDRQQPDVIDDDQLGAQDPGDGLGDGVVGAVAATSAPRCSRVNQATLRPASITAWPRASSRNVLPVPDGPQTTRFSRRSTHSRVRSACWVGAGIEERSGSQACEGLPGREPGGFAAGGQRGAVPAGDLLDQQRFEAPRPAPTVALSRWPAAPGRRVRA